MFCVSMKLGLSRYGKSIGCGQGCTNIRNIYELPQNSPHQKGDKTRSILRKQSPRCHNEKFSCPGVLVPEICVPLAENIRE